MGWFRSDPPAPDAEDAPPVRLASDEFLSGLKMLRDQYYRRATAERQSVMSTARSLSEQTHFNAGDIDRALSGIRKAITSAIQFGSLAADVSEQIESFEFRGRRPPYMPPRPEPSSGQD